MALVIAMMWRAFVWVGLVVANSPAELREHRFMIWCLGAGLLSHAVTSLSVSYTDQSMMFFWLNIGAISSMYSVAKMVSAEDQIDGNGSSADVKPKTRRSGSAPSTSPRAGQASPSGRLGTRARAQKA